MRSVTSLLLDGGQLFWGAANVYDSRIDRVGLGELNMMGTGAATVSRWWVGASTQAFQSEVAVRAAAGQQKALTFYSGGTPRWVLRSQATAEPGSNAGADFEISARDDTGAALTSPVTIRRSDGQTTLAGLLIPNSGVQVPRGQDLNIDGGAANTVIASELTGATAFTDSVASDLILKEPNTQRILLGTHGAAGAQASSLLVDGTGTSTPRSTVRGTTGALNSSRCVGAVSNADPTGGPWSVGDWVVDLTGGIRVCTVAGSPGTWVQLVRNVAPRVITSNFTTLTSYASSTTAKVVTGSAMTFTMARAGVVRAQWVLDCNSTTAGFGFAYIIPQLNGVSISGSAARAYISGSPRLHIEVNYEWFLATGTTNTIQITSNNGIASGTFNVNTDANAGGSAATCWIYDQ